MRILYVAANPVGAVNIQTDKELDLLQRSLDRVATAETIDFKSYPYIEPSDLLGLIKFLQPDILHITAHGTAEGAIFAHPVLQEVLLTADMLTDVINASTVKPRLIVLTACNSAEVARVMAGTGVFAIGTDAPITNLGSRKMAGALYHSLASGASLLNAFQTAASMLKIETRGTTAIRLFPEGSEGEARFTYIADPLRIVGSFPLIDEWLLVGHKEPPPKFRPEKPVIHFGLAGVPASSRQTLFFTDDRTVVKTKDESLLEARCWLLEDRPDDGELWMPNVSDYWGDMNWFASATTNDGRIFSASATSVEALRRYYVEEAWQGSLPPLFEAKIRESIEALLEERQVKKSRRRDRR